MVTAEGGELPTNRGLVQPSEISGRLAPTYPIYKQGYNPLTIRGMSHQVVINVDDW